MLINDFLYRPTDTLGHLTRTYTNIRPNQLPDLIEFRKLFGKREQVLLVKQNDVVESSSHSTNFVTPGDTCYFPPKFHHPPKVERTSRAPDGESPWHDNFGKHGKEEKMQGKDRKENEKQPSRRQHKKAQRSKRKIFADAQVEILKCAIPPVGLAYELEKQHRRKKR